MYECPICHKPGITAWQKYFHGPAWPMRCKQCGKKVGVPYSSVIYNLPFIVAFPVILTQLSFAINHGYGNMKLYMEFVFITLTTSIFSYYLDMKYTPLIPKE